MSEAKRSIRELVRALRSRDVDRRTPAGDSRMTGRTNRLGIGWLALLLLCTGGCRSPQQPQQSQQPNDGGQAYASAYTALMTEYRDRMAELTARPLPTFSRSSSRAESAKTRRQIAAQVDEVAAAVAGFARRMDTLEPPPQFQEVHAATRSFLAVSAEGQHRWAAAIRTGSRRKADQALKESEAAERAARIRWKKAGEALGLKVPALDEALAEPSQGAAR